MHAGEAGICKKFSAAFSAAVSGDWFVKFYAPWCVHCRKLAPVWEELATKLKGQINVAHLDATTNQQTARRFGIRGFPTLLYFKDVGELVHVSALDMQVSISRQQLFQSARYCFA